MKGFLGVCSIWMGFFPPLVCIYQEILNSLSWFGKFNLRELSNFSSLHHSLSVQDNSSGTLSDGTAGGTWPQAPPGTFLWSLGWLQWLWLLSLLLLQVLGVPRAITQEPSSAPRPCGSCGKPRVNSFGSKAALPCPVYINIMWYRQVAA